MGGTAFTLGQRDYKGAQVVVISGEDRSVDPRRTSGELQRAGRIQRHVGDEQ